MGMPTHHHMDKGADIAAISQTAILPQLATLAVNGHQLSQCDRFNSVARIVRIVRLGICGDRRGVQVLCNDFARRTGQGNLENLRWLVLQC